MDQTSAAVYAGMIAAPASAVALRSLTGWSLWAAAPIGVVGGFVGTTAAVYFLLEIIGKRAERRSDEKDK